ncbi:NUDIX hydrolase [Caballeronia sordidicola]|uniref:NUDIX hydrolase n=1 Tax=Caballeronia sordidicola TaxID=196367 RepID=UPI0004CFEC74|nr:NUDIX hydrolase [Caballeronia sordidicola]
MRPQLILIAGPYRSGTNGNAELIAGNLGRLEEAALHIYQLGHMPMIGEWVALPLAAAAGSKAVGDPISETFLYPVADRLIRQCDAVYRIDGASQGAESDVRLAKELGLPVYTSLGEIPQVATTV